jgi:hypothetical protein
MTRRLYTIAYESIPSQRAEQIFPKHDSVNKGESSLLVESIDRQVQANQVQQEVIKNDGGKQKVALGNRTSSCFIGTRKSSAEPERAVSKEDSYNSKKGQTPMYKMQKIMPQFRYCFRREAKGARSIYLM